MSRRGPKSKSDGEKDAVVADLGECPSDLSDDAKECFNRYKLLLEESGRAGCTDANTFIQYCTEWSIFRRLDRACQDAPFCIEGKNGKRKNPIFDQRNTSSRTLLGLAEKMLMTPNARVRGGVETKEQPDEGMDEYKIA